MKSTTSKFLLTLLGTVAVLGSVFQSHAQTTVTIDSTKPWGGFMNVFNLPADGGAYVFGQGWGTADLRGFFDITGTNTLTLTPNTNVYNPSSSFWVKPDGSGNKTMDASFLIQNDALLGQGITFNGTCVSNTLDAGYTSVAFIKEFDSNFGNIINQTTVTPVTGQPFSIFLQSTSGAHIQYGFETIGPDANPTNLVNLGKVVYAVSPKDPSVSTLASQAVVEGQSATFSVTAIGTAPISYQWVKIAGGVTNVLSNGGRFSGATTNRLVISNVGSADAGSYTVTANNAVSSDTVSANLVVVSLTQARTNLLVNPSFEASVFDATGSAGWVNFGASVYANSNNTYYASTTPVSIQNGTNCIFVYASGSYTGFYQERPALPGQVYTASIWFLTSVSDQIGGSNTCFLEVQFHNTNNVTIVDYVSPLVTSNTPTAIWTQFTPTGLIVAPPGTASVHYQVTYHNVGAGGSVYVDNASLQLREPVSTAAKSGANFNLTFPTVAGPTYQVFYKNSLTDATWTYLSSVVGDGNSHTVADPLGATNRFYIVNTQP